MTIDDAAYVASNLMPAGLKISRETVRRLESNLVAEEDADPIKVAALAKAFGHSYSEVSDQAVSRAKSITDLFKAPRK